MDLQLEKLKDYNQACTVVLVEALSEVSRNFAILETRVQSLLLRVGNLEKTAGSVQTTRGVTESPKTQGATQSPKTQTAPQSQKAECENISGCSNKNSSTDISVESIESCVEKPSIRPKSMKDLNHEKKLLFQVAEARPHNIQQMDRNVWAARLRGSDDFRMVAILVEENSGSLGAQNKKLDANMWIEVEKYKISNEDPPTLWAHGWAEIDSPMLLKTISEDVILEEVRTSAITPNFVTPERTNPMTTSPTSNSTVFGYPSQIIHTGSPLSVQSEVQMLDDSPEAETVLKSFGGLNSFGKTGLGKEVRCSGKAMADSKNAPGKKSDDVSRCVVRKKAEREALEAFDCSQCRDFYHAVEGQVPPGFDCSRHRYKYAPPSTPPGFWNASFPSSQM